MVIDRRAFLAGSVAAVLSPSHACAQPAALYGAARRGEDGHYGAAIFTSEGKDINAVSLPGRGHDVAVCPVTRRCVVFACRPGNFAVAFSATRTSPPVWFEAPPDRHFYGHGVFSPDGRLLYTTENDFDRGRGVIGIYDATAAFRRVGEFASFGIGPHDIALIEPGRALVVANGGIREHPDFGDGRRILNPDAIRTSLVYIDTTSGDLLEHHDLATGGRLSLRHLDVGQDGTVVLGAQIVGGTQGPADEAEHLVYRHRRQQSLSATRLPGKASSVLAGYVSSTAVDSLGTSAALTSSRSGAAVVIDVASGDVLRIFRLADVSGVASTASPGAFLLTSGTGALAVTGEPAGRRIPQQREWNWDNHAVRL